MYGPLPTIVVLSAGDQLVTGRLTAALRGRVRLAAARSWEEARAAIEEHGADAIVCALHPDTPEDISRLTVLQRRHGVGVTILLSRLSSERFTSLLSCRDLEIDAALVFETAIREKEIRAAVEHSLARSARRRILSLLSSREPFAQLLPLAAACLEAAPRATAVGAVCQLAHLSQRTAYRHLDAVYGPPLAMFFRGVRCLLGVAELARGNTVADAGRAAGFAKADTFRDWLKRIFRVTPTQARILGLEALLERWSWSEGREPKPAGGRGP